MCQEDIRSDVFDAVKPSASFISTELFVTFLFKVGGIVCLCLPF